MSKQNKYYQCELSRGEGRQVAFIEQRGAKVGNHVEILDGSNSFWKVESVSDTSVDGVHLKDLQDMNRKPFGSIL